MVILSSLFRDERSAVLPSVVVLCLIPTSRLRLKTATRKSFSISFVIHIDPEESLRSLKSSLRTVSVASAGLFLDVLTMKIRVSNNNAARCRTASQRPRYCTCSPAVSAFSIIGVALHLVLELESVAIDRWAERAEPLYLGSARSLAAGRAHLRKRTHQISRSVAGHAPTQYKGPF